MHHYKVIIFDWDGTVMDSVERIVSSMLSAAKDVALTVPTVDQIKQIIGLSIPEATKKLFPQSTPEQAEALRLSYKKHYVEIDETPTPLFSHAEQLFTDLLAQGKYLAVATGKGRDGLERVFELSNTKHYFHTSRCAKECKSKPDPDMLNQILTELNIDASEAVMIGDTTHDMLMAKNANVDRIGVTFGVHDHQALSEYQPKAIVDSLLALSNLLVKS
ncbi:HAD-IA family hydrolase [Thalassotalea sp. SU-HH00458]|uniref:HAD family hydrolase n=1 Tax=Thalassotalea sp. SU-HH00458 TaxID=3127657 RepID=UPI003109AC37